MKPKKTALLHSVIALLLCVSMLVGTTFAWFADEVKSGTNVIAAGNLDVELYHSNSIATDKKVDESTVLFVNKNGDPILWEPGAMAYETLTVKNEGSLALKYNLAMNLTNENFVVEADGTVTPYGLSNALKIGMIQGELADDVTPEEVLKQVTKWDALKSFQLTGALEAHTAAEAVTFVIYWEPSDNDNNWNVNNGKTVTDNFMQNGEYALHIDLGVHLKATQQVSESDSFGPEYDKLAPWTGEVSAVPAEVNGVITITTGAELAAFAADVNSGNSYEGKTVKLGADINLNDVAWTPIGTSACPFKGTFIGTGYTISNLYAVGKDGVGLFGRTYVGAHIEGVTVVNAYVYGNDRVGVIVGGGYLAANCIKDCTVMNAVVTATPYMTDDGKTYDGGAKAGVIIGQAYNGSITGCTAKDASVTAYRDLGGISGMLYADGVTGRTLTASGNTVENVTLTYLDLNGAAYDKNTVNGSMGDVVGRLGRSSDKCNMPVVENNTVTNVTRDTVITWVEDGVQYTKDVDTGVVTLFAITDAFVGDTLNVPSGVTNLRNKLLNGNTTIKEVVLPATVTNFGSSANGTEAATGGFFYKSAVEKITLPEGLTEIPAGAFNQAANLKEVNIPSSVTTIGIGAFGGTGLTELNIPATVTTIGGGAFRDMANLTTVTINGTDVNIPKYAFRACAKLTTVILNVDSLTLGDGMVFTNTSTNNENPNNITIYVKNDSVYNTLTSNSDVKCTVVKVAFSTNAVELQAALSGAADAGSGDNTILLTGDIDLTGSNWTPISVDGYHGAGVITIEGNGATIKGLNAPLFAGGFAGKSGIVIKNLTIADSNIVSTSGLGGGAFIDCADSMHVITLENCHLVNSTVSGERAGGLIGWCSGYAKLNDGPVKAYVTISNCSVVDSKVIGNGSAGGIAGHPGASDYTYTTIENCVIKNVDVISHEPVSSWRTGAIVGTANNGHVVINNVAVADVTLTQDGVTAEETMLYGRFVPAGTGTLVIDGAYVLPAATQEALNNAISAGETKLSLPSGTYVVPSAVSGKTVTIVGNGETVIDITTVPTYAGLPGATITFENVVIKSDPQDAGYNRGFAHTNKITYNNCVINGTLGLNTDTEFNNCTFNISGNYYNLWTWGAPNVSLNGCTINSDGKAVLLYGTANTKLTVNGCTFNDKGGLTDLKAAIEIGNDYDKSYELIVNYTAVNGYEINDKGISTGTTLWANKNSMGTDKLNVVVDGVDVY